MGNKTSLMQLSRNDNTAFRDQGDALRDERKYAEAADAYEKYLSDSPEDFDIWVQRGNCLKDAGEFAAAKMCYESAVTLNPEDADVQLQLGHLMKRQGRKADAIRYYKKSNELDPQSGTAAIELSSLGVKSKPLASPFAAAELASSPATILDITDLLFYLDVHNRVTGIQRVQSCIVHELLNKINDATVIIAYCDQNEQVIYALSTSAVSQIINTVRSTESHPDDVRADLAKIYESKVKIVPRRDDVYIILGAFWIGSDYSGSLLAMRNSGVRIGVYIYDLIPMTHPQFVTEATRQGVLDKFADVMSLADFVLTISSYVADEVAAVMASELKRDLPVLPVTLAHELPESGSEEEEVDKEFVASLPKEFVLSVCTLEGRKNHLLLLNAWSALNRKYDGNIPSLLLVGKWGWRIEEFQNQMAVQRNVDGKIVVLGNLSDTELKYLYKNCLFTVFPSFVEGWGLPVGESLAYGRPCIASNTSSIPEVGGDLVRYINPYDPIAATEVIEHVLVDRSDLQQWTQRIASDFKIRTWEDVALDFMAKVKVATERLAKIPVRAAVDLQAGEIYKLTHGKVYGAVGAPWRDRAVKFVCASGWHPLEDWGCWAMRRNATLEFGTNLPAGAKARVLVSLRLPPPTNSGTLTLHDAKGNTASAYFLGGETKWIQMETEVTSAGHICIAIERLGAVEHLQANRELYFGVDSIGYHASNDLNARINLLENFLLFNKD